MGRDTFDQQTGAAHAVISIFAPDGPPGCGRDVVRWTPDAPAEAFGAASSLTASFRRTHQTPWGEPRAFAYCLLQRAVEPQHPQGKLP